MMLSLTILLMIFVLLVMLSMVWPPDSPWAPWWKTDEKIARAACKLAKIKSTDLIYELGSGNATFLKVAAKEFNAKGVGIEIDPLRAFVSKIFLKFSGAEQNIKIIRGNFFDQDLSRADVVFVYLIPKALQKLKPKLIKELRPGTSLVSLRYKIDLPLKKTDEKNKLYLYKMADL